MPALFLWGEKGRPGLLYCSERSYTNKAEEKASAKKTPRTAGERSISLVFWTEKTCFFVEKGQAAASLKKGRGGQGGS